MHNTCSTPPSVCARPRFGKTRRYKFLRAEPISKPISALPASVCITRRGNHTAIFGSKAKAPPSAQRQHSSSRVHATTGYRCAINMGGASSKGGAAAGRAARSVARSGASAGKNTPPMGSQLPVDDDLLTKFKPTKGRCTCSLLQPG